MDSEKFIKREAVRLQRIVVAPFGTPTKADTFTLAAISEQASTFLLLHGCQINHQPESTTIQYPQGTTRQILYPVTRDERYRVMLPDKTEIREVVNCFSASYNNLLLPIVRK